MARGRPPGQGKVAGSGRQKGSLDAGQRKLITAEMAGDLLAVYRRLGGIAWLEKFARENPAEFLRQGLSRLFPAPVKDDEPGTVNNYTQINNLSDKEIACRVAFALAKGTFGDPAINLEHKTPLVERVPEDQHEYVSPPRWRPPVDVPDMPEPVEDPERERWASELPLTPEERRDQALVRNTKESSLETYAGGAGEQGGGLVERQSNSKPSGSELCRRLSRRGRDLL